MYTFIGKANSGNNSWLSRYEHISDNNPFNNVQFLLAGNTSGLGINATSTFINLPLTVNSTLNVTGTGYSGSYFSSALRPTFAIVLTNSTGAIGAGTAFNLLADPTSLDGFANNATGQALFTWTSGGGLITNTSGRSLDVYVTQQVVWDSTINLNPRSSFIKHSSGEGYCWASVNGGTTGSNYAVGSQQFTMANGATLQWYAANQTAFGLSVLNVQSLFTAVQRTRLTITVLN